MTRLMRFLSGLGLSRVHSCLALAAMIVLGRSGPLLAHAKFGQPVSHEQETEKLAPPGVSAARSPLKGALVKRKSLNLPLEAPSPEQLFQVESEEKLRARMVSEYLAVGQKKVLFPEDAVVP